MPLSLNSLSTARRGDPAAGLSLTQMFSLGGEKTARNSALCPTRTRVGDLSKYKQQIKQHKVNDLGQKDHRVKSCSKNGLPEFCS